MPEVAIGFFPDVGASYFLSRLAGKLGIYLALTGVEIRAADALYCRLADLYLPSTSIASLNTDLTGLCWRNDPAADVRSFLQARAATAVPAPSLPALRAGIDEHFSLPSVRAILASLETEHRSEYADWAQQTATLMRSRSPTMLNVTLRQLQRGAALSLADCFRMELGMAAHSFEQGDFPEGVRAVLIDKHNTPRWQPSRVEEVTDEMVDAFFRDRWSTAAHPLATLGR
jgi:enoyl-CoA hydratase/carnithine racemase